MKVLLTGSAGFIGTAIASALEERGDEVVRVDLRPLVEEIAQRPSVPLVEEVAQRPSVPLVEEVAQRPSVPPVEEVAQRPSRNQGPHTHLLDVRDAGSWSGLLHGVDAVCHQAALVGAGTNVADLPAYAAHNDLGTAALLAAMAEVRVGRLVLASSMVVYGEGRYACPEHGRQDPPPRKLAALDVGEFDNKCPACGAALGWELVPEDAPFDPRSSYAASKVAQEHYARAWARQAGGRAVALRYHNVYGPGMPRDTPYSGVAALFRSALELGEAPRVFEDGGQLRDFVHVTDVARANLAALDAVADRAAGDVAAYNVCSGTPITIREVAEMVARGGTSGRDPMVTGEYRLGDVRHVVASPERAARDLGFRADIQPEVGLPEFATAPLRA